LSEFCLQDLKIAARVARVIRSIDFYDDLAKWTAIEVIECAYRHQLSESSALLANRDARAGLTCSQPES